MKKDSGLIFHIFLIFGDACAILLSFFMAYFARTHIDQRPFYFEVAPFEFVLSLFCLVPLYILILAAFGLYKKSIFLGSRRWSEFGRLFLASVVGVMAIIAYDFFFLVDLFPVRVMALYTIASCFIFLCLFRGIVRFVRGLTFKSRRGTLSAIIIGNSRNTEFLADYISAFPESGFTLSGVVASKKYIPKDLKKRQYSSLKEALRRAKPDVIFQTDDRRTDYVYQQAINRHLLYYFVPSNAMLTSQMGELELVGDTPAILVRVTPLAASSARFVKRLSDIIISLIGLIIAAIPMLIIYLVQKIMNPKASAFYADVRLSRYNRRVKIYKFRSMKPEFCGLSPEEAFKKIGKPNLIKKYRDNGDMIDKDPRITGFGHFLRSTSLDELPQLFNVLKGDISLVGPRALVPGELRHYGDRSLLLSVKSGLTGLAQVSGRRDIGFDERRALDLYYIQNWSLGLDFRIMLRTFWAILTHRGAK